MYPCKNISFQIFDATVRIKTRIQMDLCSHFTNIQTTLNAQIMAGFVFSSIEYIFQNSCFFYRCLILATTTTTDYFESFI